MLLDTSPAQTTFILSLHVQHMHVSKFVNPKQICNQNLRTLPLSFEFQSIDMVSWDGATILPLRMEYSNN